MTGCVASIQGVSGPIAWEATDFRVVERSASGAIRDIYAFTLVLQETHGTEITLTHMEQTVSQPGVHTTGVTRQFPIHWKLRPRGELRQPFSFYWYCADTQCHNRVSVAPWYNLVFAGIDQRGQPVHIAMDFRLPTNPARPKIGPPGESSSAPQPEAASTPLLRDSGAVPFQTAVNVAPGRQAITARPGARPKELTGTALRTCKIFASFSYPRRLPLQCFTGAGTGPPQ